MDVERDTLAIFGGTFNPIHVGHIAIAEFAKRELGYKKVLLIPSSIPAHKDADPSTSAVDRVAMMKLAVRGVDHILIDTCEIERGGVSYMIDTLDYVETHYTYAGKPGLIIGDDLLEGFHKWRRVDELLGRVDLIVARRLSVKKKDIGYEHTYLDNPVIEAASSDIRGMTKYGGGIDEYVPDEVSRYIAKHRLYGSLDTID